MTGFLLAAPLRDFVARVVVVSTFLKTYIIVFYGNFVKLYKDLIAFPIIFC